MRTLSLALVVLVGCGAGVIDRGEATQAGAQALASPYAGAVILNEVLANEPGSSTAGEFVELVNLGASDVDLSGWTLSDSTSVRHTFAAGTTLGAGLSIEVYGGASGIPAGLTSAVAASTGTLSLNNSSDQVHLRDASGADVDAVSYGSALASTDGVSMNRSPDATAGAPFVLHTTLSALSSSPGLHADRSAFAPPAPPDAGTPDAGAGATLLRVMTGNLTSGNYQTYDPGEGIRIFQGLHPDVAMVEEFNFGTNSPDDVRHFVDQAFGTDFVYYREQNAAQIPNGIVSRYPILAAGEWTDPYVSNRDWVWAHIDLPGPRDLWVVALHLLTSSSTNRNLEATALVQQLQASIPAGDFLVVGGDLNTSSRGELCLSTLASVVDTAAAFPVDEAGNGNTNATRSKPYDWVLADAPLEAYQVPVQVGAQTFPAGLVFDSRVYSPLTDVAPVLQTDSAAVNMQHMGVVKEFEIPVQ